MTSQIPKKIIRPALASDFEELEKLGFVINLKNDFSARFVNTHFPDLNLLEWLGKVEALLVGMGNPPMDRKILFSSDPDPQIEIIYHDHEFRDPVRELALERTIKKVGEKIIVKHEGFRIPQANRGQGVAKKIFNPSIQQYVNIGTDHIMVDAGLSHGGLVWGKYGFAATKKSDMEEILVKAKNALSGTEFDVVKAIFDSYYDKNPNGSNFSIIRWAELDFMEPVLVGTNWEGILDFNNTGQLINFISYVH